MSPITQLSALAFAAGALAVPGAHNNFHAWQVNHAHGRYHSSKSVAGTASSGTAAGTGVPYPYPNANGTAIGGSTGSGFATGTAPVSMSSQSGPRTQTVVPVGYEGTTTSVTTSVVPSSSEAAPAGYDSSSSSACGGDVTVTTTEKTYITVTAGGASSSSVEASATQPSSSSGRKTSTVTQYSTYYPNPSSSYSSAVQSSSSVSSSAVESAAPSFSSSQTSLSTSYSSPAQYTSSEAAPPSTSSSYSAPAQSSSSEAAPEQATSSSYSAPAAYSSSSSWAAPESTSSSYSAPAETSSTWAAPESTSSSYSAPAAYSTSSALPSVTFSAAAKGLGGSSSAAPTSSAAAATPSSYSSGGSTSGSFSGKRGLAYNDASLTSCFGGASKVGWAYNWGSSSNGLDMDVSYVPLLWGTSEDFTGPWSDNAQAAIDSGSQYLFSFNEPDMSSQANLSPEDAAEAYKKYMSPFAGKAKMCAPSVTNGGGAMGLTWLSNFLDACSDCQIDCVSIHWYDSYQNTEYFKDHVNNATEIAPGKEVFVSEFGTTDGSDEQVSEFLQDVMPWMGKSCSSSSHLRYRFEFRANSPSCVDSKDEVAGYAYFMVSEGMLVSGDAASSYGSTYMNYSG